MRHLVLLLLILAVAHATVTIKRTSDDGPHPTAMEIEVRLPNSKKVRIPLSRTDAFENVRMTVARNGVSRTFSTRQVRNGNHSHYRDVESKSVISVRNEYGRKRFSGHVTHNGTSYFLEPMGSIGHRVTEGASSNVDPLEKQNDASRASDNEKSSGSQKETQRTAKNTQHTRYTIEIYMLIDSSAYSVFEKMFGQNKALTELWHYYTHILNGMDVVYRNMGTPSISISCIGIEVSESAEDDYWIEDTRIGKTILRRMGGLFVDRAGDHIMAFTRFDIKGGALGSKVVGLSPVGGCCTKYRVSVIEDHGLHTWGTAAHELAHNVGAEHDGVGNRCSGSRKHLMSPTTNSYTLSDVAFSYQFSPCTVKYITEFLASLGKSNCLTRKADDSKFSVPMPKRPIGALLTLDQTCQLSYPKGPGKFYRDKRLKTAFASICAKIICVLPSGWLKSRPELRAPAGTPCGFKSSCTWTGQCVRDAYAPPVYDSCVHEGTC